MKITNTIFIFLLLLITVLLTKLCAVSKTRENNIVIAVNPFEGTGKDNEASILGYGVSEVISYFLNAVPEITLIEKTHLAEVLDQIKFGRSGITEPETSPKIGKIPNPKYLITGNVQKSEKDIRITAKIILIENNKTIASTMETGKEEDIFKLQENIAKVIVNKLGQKTDLSIWKTVSESIETSLSAFRNWSEGNKEFSKHNWQKAKQNYEDALQSDPSFIYTIINLGVVYERQNKLDKALAQYKKALSISDKIPEVYFNMGNVYYKKQKYEEALKYYNKAIKIRPNYYAASINATSAIKVLNPYPAKFNVIWREVKTPDAPNGQVDINGLMVFQLRSDAGGYTAPERARIIAKRLEKFINKRLSPNDISTGIINREVVVMFRHSETIVTIDTTLAFRYSIPKEKLAALWAERLKSILNNQKPPPPDIIQSTIMKGDEYFNDGNMDAAIKEYEKAVNMGPSRPGSHFVLGGGYRAVERFNEAIREYKEALRLSNAANQKYTEASIFLGVTYLQIDEQEKAIKTFEQASGDDPHSPYSAVAYNNIGYVLLGEEKYTEAKNYFEKAIKVYEELDVQQHITSLKESLAVFHKNLADCFANLENVEQAKLHYKEALRLDPKLEEAQSELEKLE